MSEIVQYRITSHFERKAQGLALQPRARFPGKESGSFSKHQWLDVPAIDVNECDRIT